MPFPTPLSTLKEQNQKLNLWERTQGLQIVESFPLVAKIEVTTRCNLRCTMCSVSYREKGNHGEDLDFDLFLKLKPLFPYLISTYLYGIGEPLLHPRAMDMFDLLSNEGVNVGFITNGVLIDQRKMERWLQGGLYKLSVSMDGATKETYESIRRWGNFDKLLANLECVKILKEDADSPFPILTLNFVVMRQNLQDLVPLVEKAHHFGAEEVIITELLAFTENMKTEVVSYGEPILHQTYETAERLAKELGVRLVLPNSYIRWRDKRLVTVSSQGISTELDLLTHEIPFASCTEPWSGFWLSQKGLVDPCCYWFENLGNLAKNEFHQIWNNDRYQFLRQTVNDPEKRHNQCRKCPVPT